MKILFVSTEFEEKARGITGIIKAMIRAAKEDGHEVGILAGYPGVYMKKSGLLNKKVEHIYLQHYFDNGRHNIFPGGLHGKKNQAKILLKREFLKPYEFKVDHDLVIHKLNTANSIDYVIKTPYIYQLINHGAEALARRIIKKAVRKFNIDLVITGAPMNLSKKDVYPAKLAQFVHDTMPIDMLETPADNNTPVRFAHQLYSAAAESDLVFVNSKDTQSKVLEVNLKANTQIVYGTASNIPSDIKDTAILKNLDIKSDNYLFYLSAMEKRKNISGIFDAYTLIHDDIKMPLVLAGGKGYGYDEIKKHYDSLPKDIKKDIIILDYISEGDKYTLFRNARTFVFPSFNEGIGLQIIEALSTNLPVVTSRRGALPEAGGDAVYYVENPYNPNEIADAILKVTFDDKLRKNLLQNASKQVKKFTREGFTSRFIEGLHKLEKN